MKCELYEKVTYSDWFCYKNVGFCVFLWILSIVIFCIFAIMKKKKYFEKYIGQKLFIRKIVDRQTKRKEVKKVYTAMNVASEIVRQYEQKEKLITNLKLQKILYYTQMQSMQQEGCALFSEDFQAWRHGPVIPEVYEAFRKYVSGNIDYHDKDVMENRVEFSVEQRKVIEKIVDLTLNVTAWELVEKTHQTKPWKDTYIPNRNCIISKERICRDGQVNIS